MERHQFLQGLPGLPRFPSPKTLKRSRARNGIDVFRIREDLENVFEIVAETDIGRNGGNVGPLCNAFHPPLVRRHNIKGTSGKSSARCRWWNIAAGAHTATIKPGGVPSIVARR